MKITEESYIGQIVASDYRTASIFESYNIDYCCNGNRSLKTACKTLNIEPEELIIQINSISGMQTNLSDDFTKWSLDKLVNYIEEKHHKYVEEKSLEITPLLQKICQVHAAAHPELFKISELFITSVQELTKHMKKEELILFPYINKMAKRKKGDEKWKTPIFGTIKNPISMMEGDHDQEGDRFREIKKLTQNFQAPKDACATYRRTFALLQEFEKDLHQHIHLENNILFPKSIAMEEEVFLN